MDGVVSERMRYPRPVLARWLVAILALPGVVTVLVPALILWRSPHALASPASVRFWGGLLVAACGLATAVWTWGLFGRTGEGTLAPWDPPRRFVVRGPYCHVRNPMILGLFVLLLGEAVLCGSWLILGWMAAFVAANLLFIPLVEEPKLRGRFGADYEEYCRHVHRWLPRLHAWRQPD